MAENENNGVVIENDEQADAQIDIPDVSIDEGADTVEMSRADVEKLKKGFQTAMAQKQHWKKKASVKPSENQQITSAPKPEDRQDDDMKRTVESLKLSDDKRNFGYRHQLSPEETDNAFALAQGMGLKPEDVLNHPFFKNGLEATRAAARNASNTPSSSNRSPQIEGKTFDKMSDDERKNNFAAVVGALGKK